MKTSTQLDILEVCYKPHAVLYVRRASFVLCTVQELAIAWRKPSTAADECELPLFRCGVQSPRLVSTPPSHARQRGRRQKRVSILSTWSISQLSASVGMRIVQGVENLYEPTVWMQGIPQRRRQLRLLLLQLHGKDPGRSPMLSPSVTMSRSILFVHQAIVTERAPRGVRVFGLPTRHVCVATANLFH